MGDSIQIEAGAKAAWDVLKLDRVQGRDYGPGAEANVGIDLSLNPSDDIRAMIVASGTGLFHNSAAGRFFGVTPELGFGVGGRHVFARLMGGPLWINTLPHPGGTGHFDLGIRLGERAALTLGLRYILFPKFSTITEKHTDIVLTDPSTGKFEFVDRRTTYDQDAAITRYCLGLEITLF